MDVPALAAIASDRDAPVRKRVEALIAVVEAVSIEGAPLPIAIVDALDDSALIDASIAMRKTSFVCAALHQLGVVPELASTRKRVVRRLIAAGAQGIELAGLAIDIGDVVPGVALAVRDFDTAIMPRLRAGGPDPLVSAWLSWLSDQPDIAVANILRQLTLRAIDLDAVLALATNPTKRARLQASARSIVPS